MPIFGYIVRKSAQFIRTNDTTSISVLTGLLHAFVVLHSKIIFDWSIWNFTFTLCLEACHGLLVFVLVCSMKIWICSPELGVLVSSEHLLYLLVIELGQATQSILLKPKGSWTLEMSKAIVFKGILIIIDGVVCAQRLILVGNQVMHFARLEGLSI